LRRIAGMAEAVGNQRWAALSCTAREFPRSLSEGATTTKVYAVYEDAWWVSKLDLLRGLRENLTTSPPVSIHYHDGEVLCSDGQRDIGGAVGWKPARDVDPPRRRCRGVLQVFYRHSQSCPAAFPECMDFWAGLPRSNESNPVTLVDATTYAAGASLLRSVHEKLVEMHGAQLDAAGISSEEIAAIAPPSALLFSVWYHDGTFPARDERLLTGPQDLIFRDRGGGALPAACSGGAGPLPATAYREHVLGLGEWASGPDGQGLHVVNNDFVATEATAWHGPWAEQTLLAAEQLLARAFELKPPGWLNSSYYEQHVLQPTQPTVAVAAYV